MVEEPETEAEGRKTRRVQFEFPPRATERLEKLKEQTDAASYAEVVRAALRIYEWVLEVEAAGLEIAAVRDGEIKRVMVML